MFGSLFVVLIMSLFCQLRGMDDPGVKVLELQLVNELVKCVAETVQQRVPETPYANGLSAIPEDPNALFYLTQELRACHEYKDNVGVRAAVKPDEMRQLNQKLEAVTSENAQLQQDIRQLKTAMKQQQDQRQQEVLRERDLKSELTKKQTALDELQEILKHTQEIIELNNQLNQQQEDMKKALQEVTEKTAQLQSERDALEQRLQQKDIDEKNTDDRVRALQNDLDEQKKSNEQLTAKNAELEERSQQQDASPTADTHQAGEDEQAKTIDGLEKELLQEKQRNVELEKKLQETPSPEIQKKKEGIKWWMYVIIISGSIVGTIIIQAAVYSIYKYINTATTEVEPEIVPDMV